MYENIGVIQLIDKLTGVERKEILSIFKYQSRKKENLEVKVFNFLIKNLRTLREIDNSIDFISKNLLKNKNISIRDTRIYLSKIYKTIMNHLVRKKFEEKILLQKRIQLEILKEKELVNIFKRESTKIIKEFSENRYTSEEYLEISKIYSTIWNNLTESIVLHKTKSFINSKNIREFSYFYFLLYLFIEITYNEVSIQSDSIRTNNEFVKSSKTNLINELFENLLLECDKNDYFTSEKVLLVLYKHFFDCYNNIESEEKFKNYKQFLFSNYCDIPEYEYSIHLTKLIEYIIFKFNITGNPKLEDDLYLLYYEYISNENFKINSKTNLSVEDSINFIKIANKVGKLKSASKLINEKADYIKSEYRNQVLNYINALSYFEEKDFANALNCMNKFDYKFHYSLVDYKILYLKVLIESKDVHNTISYCNSFLSYLNQNVYINNESHKRLKSFVIYCRSIAKNYDRKVEIGLIKQKIEIDSNVSNGKWLLEKCNSIIHK